MQGSEGVLEPPLKEFVERHVKSLLAWDILMFFHRNPDTPLNADDLAGRLGRGTKEIELEVRFLCEERILCLSEELIRFGPADELREAIDSFFDACQDRKRRLALIALVLHQIGHRS